METERDKWNLEKSVRENRLASETTAHRGYTQFIFFPRGESSSYVGFCKEAKCYGGMENNSNVYRHKISK